MNKLIKRLFFFVSLSVALLATGCSDDIAPEVTELNLDRLLSPVELTAEKPTQTSIILKWKRNPKAESYQIRILKGEQVVAMKSVSFAETPYTVTELAAGTEYTAQVKATATGQQDSHYTAIVFSTNP